ncbi:DYW domain containing protein [Balamuthia mandrillaris]
MWGRGVVLPARGGKLNQGRACQRLPLRSGACFLQNRRYYFASSFRCCEKSKEGKPRRSIQEQRHTRNSTSAGFPQNATITTPAREAGLGREHTRQLQGLARGAGRLQAGVLSSTLEEMERAGVRAEDRTYMDLLKRCKQERSLQATQRVHAHLLSLSSTSGGRRVPSSLAASLISAYGACGKLDQASAVFKQHFKEGEPWTWNAMMQARTQCGHGKEALELFQEMQQAGVPAGSLTFSIVLKACAMAKDLEAGKRVHAELLRRGSLSVSESTALINMYGKCGRMEEARAVFQNMKERDVVTWTAMITGETQSGCGKEALELFKQMQQAGVPADPFTFASILKACAMTKDLEVGKRVHAELLRRGLLGTSESTALINMYGKCGRMEEARSVFRGMTERNVVTWTSMITEETQSGHGKEALELFKEMQWAGVSANSFTFASVLKACAMIKDLEAGKRVHAELLSRGMLRISEANALINMYGKCGRIEEARAVFHGMNERDVVTWTAMITEETQSGHGKEALALFQEMKQKGVPVDSMTFASVLKACAMTKDLEVGKRVHAELLRRGSLSVSESNALISMYGKCGRIEEARSVFRGMKERNVVTWTSMITEETQSGCGKEALELFKEMQQAGMPADAFTFAGALKACADTADLAIGKQVHSELLHRGLIPDVLLSTALINMYGKCGRIEEARAVFQEMKEQNIVSWNAMIAVHGLHGQGKEALATFDEMQQQGVQPDAITFTNVLNACSHAGLVEEGMACFADMTEKHSIQPTVEHYNCMVDLLGRAGRVEEAETLIHAMEVPPDAVTWMALLGACRGTKDVQRGKRAAEKAIELDPENAAPFVVLSNILAAAGQWKEVERVRKQMEERNVKKEPGRSWITVDGQLHSFVVKDRSHPRSPEIYQQLAQLDQLMKAAGYKPDTDWVLHDVPDEQKEEELCHHSEKLAIAFGLLSTPPGQPLRIIKNLRVCGDCHTATKFIAKVTQREILVRDANRFHYFSPDGRHNPRSACRWAK